MALSRLAQQFAAEISNHDWSDAPYRFDRAGHDRTVDGKGAKQLEPHETDRIRENVMAVTAQVLGYQDPNFDEYEFAEACGVDTRTAAGRPRSGTIRAGLRIVNGQYCRPGTWDTDED